MDIHKMLRSLFLAVALAFLAPLTGFGGAVFGVDTVQAQTVRSIDVSGNQRVDDSTVRSYLTIRVGDAATTPAIQNSIASLNATGLFSAVDIRFGSGVLRVSVTENPIVAAVLFEGNQRFNDDELLAMVNLASLGAYSQSRLDGDINSIKAAYDQVGYTNATVTARTETADNSRILVTFVIDEGNKAGVAAINFTGNSAFSSWTLKSIMSTKETNIMSWLFQDDTYSEDKLAADREAVRLFYANRGYPDAQVAAVAEFDASRNAYFISVTVNEGERYTFGDVSVETSISGLNTDALRGAIRTYQGQRYSYEDLQRTSEDMAVRATSQGYAFADVRPRLNRDNATHTFQVTYLVDQGARVYIQRINITGNEKTRDFVIRRELPFAEGDPFNSTMVSRGKANIEALNYFSAVNLTTERGTAPDKIVINIAVVEKSTGDYGVSAGYSTVDGILGEISLTERNFLGRGQYLKVSTGASQNGQTYNFTFTEPHFLGMNISAGIDLYRKINEETPFNYYGLDNTGGDLRFGVPLTDNLKMTLNGGIEHQVFTDCYMWDKDSNPNTPDVPLKRACPDSTVVAGKGQVYNHFFVGYNLNYTNVDDEQHPMSGLVANLSQQYSFLTGNYLRSEIKARYYVPLLPDYGVVGSIRGQAGMINDFGGNMIATEAFYPGQNLVRGFDGRGMGPRAANGEPLGATVYAGVSAEVMFPLPGVPENYGLSGAFWGDMGYVANAPASSAPAVTKGITQQIRSSVGTSLIWDSPFGPLRGDLAYLLQRDKADQPNAKTSPLFPWAFQLSLQTLL